MKDILKTEDMAAILKTSEPTIRHLLKLHEVPITSTRSNSIRVKREDFEKLLEVLTVEV